MRLLFMSITIGIFIVAWCFVVKAQLSILDDAEYVEAVGRMYGEQMTKYKEPEKFRPEDLVTREQAAKFFVGYATNVLLHVIDTSRYCSFDDIEDADLTLKNSILQSCLLRLFKGNQGKFYPTTFFTKAQALAVIVRTIDGKSLDESWVLWWQAYYDRSIELGLIKETEVSSLDRPLSRYELALLLWRSAPKNE